MIFYLVLRALDTVEDDMSFPTDIKIDMLKKFHEFLYQPGWTFEGCGEGKEKELLQNFDKVINVFSNLKERFVFISNFDDFLLIFSFFTVIKRLLLILH